MNAQNLLEFIQQCPSPYYTVRTLAHMLTAAGFQELDLTDLWELEPGGRYFVKIYGTTLIGFAVGKKEGPVRIGASHTDFPCFRIKPQPEISKEGYGTLNVEGYGGMIVSTWMDRPLSAAGMVSMAGPDPFHPRMQLIDFKRPVAVIPSLAIHMNRTVNDGYAWNKQKDVLPLAALGVEKDSGTHFFRSLVAREAGCSEADLLSYELSFYPVEAGCLLGISDEFISSPRLDNLTSVKAVADGLIASDPESGISVGAFFDHEEVGSRTKQGAGSLIFLQVLERIYAALGRGRERLYADLGAGFMLSVDVAHAFHPNYGDKCDPTHKPVLGGGVVLKESASQSYAGDAEAVGVITGLCRQHGIPCQTFVNRGDIAGGSTLGSIASALVPVRTMDIGVPLLAMHSARETMGRADQEALTRLLEVFFA